jgi:iron complex outermembrane receptor protein
MTLNYSGQLGVSSAFNTIQTMEAAEFVAAGGTDLGSVTNWTDAVTRDAITRIHNISASGGSGDTSYRIAANFRDVQGVLISSDFNQFNTRLNFTTRALNDKLRLTVNTAFTKREQNNGDMESLKYAILYNPTAPILAADYGGVFNGDQYGGYFETLGLFDSYNPVSIARQQINAGDKTELNYSVNAEYGFNENLSINLNAASQVSKYSNKLYNPTTLLRGGNAASPIRKGSANFYDQTYSFKLSEVYARYNTELAGNDLVVTAGYSHQMQNFNDHSMTLGDFPNETAAGIDFINAIEYSQDLLGAGFIQADSNATPDEKIIAFFGRVNYTINDAIFLNASLRREGSTKLGSENQWGLFPSAGLGVDLENYLNLGADKFKVRLGYGVTGALPGPNGLSQQIRGFTYASATGGGSSSPSRDANPDLKWEEKGELNVGIDFLLLDSKLSGTIDYFNRTTSDLLRITPVSSPPNIYNQTLLNLGELETNGFEVTLNYAAISTQNFSWDVGVNLATFKVNLINISDQEEFVTYTGNLNAPGLNYTYPIVLEEGGVLGNIRAGEFAGYNAEGRTLIVNQETGEATVERNLDRDGIIVGNGLPDYTFGISNVFRYNNWDLNVFLRGATGHSLVNIPRAYGEHPSISGRQNFVYTKYFNAADTEQDAYHSNMVEKADFLRLDNAALGYNFKLPENSKISNLRLYVSGNNLFTITDYTGSDPEVRYKDVRYIRDQTRDILTPGIDRRTTYFPTKTYTVGVNINF